MYANKLENPSVFADSLSRAERVLNFCEIVLGEDAPGSGRALLSQSFFGI